MEKVAERDGRRRHLPPDPGRGLLRRPEATEQGTAVADPFFGGAGPDRRTCIDCGECMTGCRHNAKNTLVKNYLYLAEQNGAQVHAADHGHPRRAARRAAGTTYACASPRPSSDGARRARCSPPSRSSSRPSALGTQRLLHRMKDEGHLPGLSDRLGHLSRTNSESILGAIAPRHLGRLHARASRSPRRFHPDEHTHIEPCRYGKGSNAMALLQTVLTDGDGPAPRWRTWLHEIWRAARQRPRPLRPQALVGAHRDRAGHAEPRQLDHRPTPSRSRAPRSGS